MTQPTPRAVAVYILIHSPSPNSLQSEPNFLVVSSRKHKNKFVLPKGGIEEEIDDNEIDAAEREAWEEAGVIPGQLHLSTLLLLPDTQPHPQSPSPLPSSPDFIPCTTYSIQLFSTTSTKISDILCPEAEWPEREEREERNSGADAGVLGRDVLEEEQE